MNRLAWPAVAAAAVGFLIALALTGARNGSGFEPFIPRGLMTMTVEAAREVDVATAAAGWHFVREPEGWRATSGTPAVDFQTHVQTALTLLRNSGPERVLTEAEIAQAGAAQFGLEPPRLRVVVTGADATTFAISFGASNPLGSAHYARVDGAREIALLPAFVAEECERTGAAP